MKRSVLAGALLMSAALLFAPADTARAKEVPADGNIPLTSGYFPDAWFMDQVTVYDKNKDGFLSSEEIAAVTDIWCSSDLTDFSQIQYFTNLKELTVKNADEDMRHDIWVGEDLDLTVFPSLEHVSLYLDSGKAPADGANIQIKISGLEKLKSFRVHDSAFEKDETYSGSHAKIAAIDFRNTKALEEVVVSDVQGVIFDDTNQIKKIYLANVAQIAADQFDGFGKLESLSLWANVPSFTQIDLKGADAITELTLKNKYLEQVKISGKSQLKTVEIQSDLLRNIDLSLMPGLTRLVLECPGLEKIDLSAANALEWVSVQSDVLSDLVVSENQELKDLRIKAGALASLNVSKNAALEELSIESGLLKKLDLKKNKKLQQLSVACKKMTSLDLSANTKLTWLSIDGTPLKSLNLSKLKELGQLYFQNNTKLSKLDVSKNTKLRTLEVENTAIKSLDVSKLTKLDMLEVNGNKKLTKLDLSKNKKLSYVDVSNNVLKTLKLGSKAKISYLNCSKNKLTTLNVSQLPYLSELVCDKKVKVKGYKGKITRV